MIKWSITSSDSANLTNSLQVIQPIRPRWPSLLLPLPTPQFDSFLTVYIRMLVHWPSDSPKLRDSTNSLTVTIMHLWFTHGDHHALVLLWIHPHGGHHALARAISYEFQLSRVTTGWPKWLSDSNFCSEVIGFVILALLYCYTFHASLALFFYILHGHLIG